jgi:hypothetical protein
MRPESPIDGILRIYTVLNSTRMPTRSIQIVVSEGLKLWRIQYKKYRKSDDLTAGMSFRYVYLQNPLVTHVQLQNC